MSGESLDLEAHLPALREDLQIMEGAKESNGARRWLIFDPLRHRYFQIDESAVRILHAWKSQTVADVISSVDGISLEDVEILLRFLLANSLMRDPPGNNAESFVAQADAGKKSFLESIVHNYLFIRIPLVRPHAFLKRTVHLTDFFFDKRWWVFVLAVGVFGLYLTSRQWDAFTSTFLHFFNIKGLALYFFALMAVKVCHELGHAYATTRYGGRVATMGVAFLVMFPVLFTDTTDSWKLTSRKKRLVITGAGVAAELTIAVFATLLWVFLPDGPWRSVAFVVATTSWVMSIAVNINPLMRFDGYHFLSDLIGVSNLQSRSFALGRWAMREMLFGLNDPAPEAMTKARRRTLISFAWATWIYRFFLFLGIALLVHAIFFKALGIALFIVEIGWFIAIPILNEMRIWFQRRNDILERGRIAWPAAMVAVTFLGAIVPWQTTIRMPAVMEAQNQISLYPARAAQVDKIHAQPGDRVEKGDILIEFVSPDLNFELGQTIKRIKLARARLDRIAVDADALDQKIILQRELIRLQKQLAGLEAEAQTLKVVAPFSGIVTDMDPALHTGRWMARTNQLMTVLTDGEARIRALISADNAERLSSNAYAVFIPQLLDHKKTTSIITAIAQANEAELVVPALASRYGGPIAVADQEDTLEPIETWYAVFAETSASAPDRIIRGELQAKGRPESIASKIWRRVMQVLVIETSL
ncbi:MAG: site-2 protease family protein [Pseudomonadota bacterium]